MEHIFERSSEKYIKGLECISVVHERGRGIAWRIWPGAHALLDWLENNIDQWCESPCHVVEIGAGVGLVGVACAALGADKVTLTDLPEELVALERSKDSNCEIVRSKISVMPLRFGEKSDIDTVGNSHTGTKLVIVGSELIYWESLFEPIAETLKGFIIDYNAVAYIGYRTRVWKTEKRFFTKILHKHGLDCQVVGEWLAMEEDATSQTTDGHVVYHENPNGEWNTRVYMIKRLEKNAHMCIPTKAPEVDQENKQPKEKKKPKKIVRQEKKGKSR